jgi:hypothetical protein
LRTFLALGLVVISGRAQDSAKNTKIEELISKSMDIVQRQMADLIPEIQRITTEAIEKSKSADPKM